MGSRSSTQRSGRFSEREWNAAHVTRFFLLSPLDFEAYCSQKRRVRHLVFGRRYGALGKARPKKT